MKFIAFKQRVSGPLISAIGRLKETRNFDKPPVLIGGAPRSGTTLLLAILAAHPGIWAVDYETNMFRHWKARSNGNPDRPLLAYRFYRQLLTHSIPRTANRWCEKTPCHVRFIDKILAWFANEVRFIHIVRDGRDVMTSVYPQQPDRFFVSPEQWCTDVNAGLIFQDHPLVLTMKYEDLVADNLGSIGRICNFLDEPVHPHIVSWHEYSKKRKDKAWASPLSTLYKDSVGRWRKPEYEQRVRDIMAHREVPRLLERLNYR